MIFSVIIPTYNRVDKLERCVLNILNQSVSLNNYEVIIVDDCSQDGTEEFCCQLVNQNSNVRYIRNQVNKGRCVTRNEGIRAAQGKYLVFLDNDLLTSPNFLESQLDYFKKHAGEKIAIINNTTYPNEVLAGSNFGAFIQSRAIGYSSEGNMRYIDYNNIPANYFAGGGSSVSKEDAFSIGLFEESLKKYGSEDELFGYRFIKSGGKIIFNNETKIIHDDDNISPKFWKTKFMELGKYGLRTLVEKEPQFVKSTLYTYLMPVNVKEDEISKVIKKMIINIVSTPLFWRPIEYIVFNTDHLKNFNIPIFYRYITVVWMKRGFLSQDKIEEVKY